MDPTTAAGPEPYDQAEVHSLQAIRLEAEKGLPNEQHRLDEARDNLAYYRLDNRRYIPRRPAEDDQDYRQRPKKTSKLTRRAIEVLAEHLYAPGPTRRLQGSPAIDAWLQGVYSDNHVDALFQEADRLATLNGVIALQVAATANARRPIRLHLWGREEFAAWTMPGDPCCLFALCTIAREDERTTYTLWTRSEYLTYRTEQAGDGRTAGGRVAQFVPAESGEHRYGVLPFACVHARNPVQCWDTTGIGTALREANAEIDIEMSDLAEAIKFYNRPIGFSTNVKVDWRPRLRPGSFQDLPARTYTAGGNPAEPKVFYLQATLDVLGVWADITNTANTTFEELDVPLSAVRMEQTGTASGIAIVAEQAPLLSRARARRQPFARYETELARVVLACEGHHAGRPDLVAASLDVQLALAWPEPTIPIPGPDRDEADANELALGLTSEIQILMRRRGLSRVQAIDELEQIAADVAEAARIKGGSEPKAETDPAADPATHQIDPKAEDQSDNPEDDG